MLKQISRWILPLAILPSLALLICYTLFWLQGTSEAKSILLATTAIALPAMYLMLCIGYFLIKRLTPFLFPLTLTVFFLLSLFMIVFSLIRFLIDFPNDLTFLMAAGVAILLRTLKEIKALY